MFLILMLILMLGTASILLSALKSDLDLSSALALFGPSALLCPVNVLLLVCSGMMAKIFYISTKDLSFYPLN